MRRRQKGRVQGGARVRDKLRCVAEGFGQALPGTYVGKVMVALEYGTTLSGGVS